MSTSIAQNSTQSVAQRNGHHELVVLIAVASGVLATTADAAPTGHRVWDATLTLLFVALVVIAGSRAPRWATLIFSTVALALVGFNLWSLFAIGSLALGAMSVWAQRRHRIVGALVVALAMQALMRLPAFGFFGLPSLVVALVSIIVLVTGYRYASRSERRWARWGTAAIAVVPCAIVIVAGVALLGVRSDITRGMSAARNGLAAAREGDNATVSSELGLAQEALESAHQRVESLPVRALRLVPIAAQHSRALETATFHGARITEEAAAALNEANIEEISFSSGRIDVGALREMAPRLRSTAESLEVAAQSITQSNSSWLLPVATDRIDELQEEIEALTPEARLAAEAAEVVPAMLGADRPQTYFVIFGTPAESRELGGFLGSWALIEFDDGRIRIGDSGRVGQLFDIAETSSIRPGTVSGWFLEMARPIEFPQNLTSSPDFLQVAEVTRQVVGAISEEPIDAFVYLDAWAVTDMLALTGPVEIPFQEAPLTSENAPAFFFEAQYRFDSSRTELFDGLVEVGRAAIDRMSTQALPGPEDLGRILGPAARAGRLQVVTFDDRQNAFLESVQLLRSFSHETAQDFVGFVQTNGLSNKIDVYLERELDYQVTTSLDGSLTATATATLRSVIPSDAPEFALGPPENNGDNYVLLSLYSPHQLVGARVNGAPVSASSTGEFGLERYLVEVRVPASGEPVVVEFDVVGSVSPEQPYSVEIWHQPLVNTDQVAVQHTGSETNFGWNGLLVENIVVTESGANGR